MEISNGQVWQYNNRIGEESSLLTILGFDDSNPKQRIIHVSVDRLKKSNGEEWSISHLPFDANVLIPSLQKLISNVTVEPNEGYLYWKEEFDNGRAGVWSVDIQDAINLTEKAYQDL